MCCRDKFHDAHQDKLSHSAMNLLNPHSVGQRRIQGFPDGRGGRGTPTPASGEKTSSLTRFLLENA